MCGESFCGTHSKQRVMLPGYKKKQRVCDPCHKSMSQPAPPTRKSSVRTSSSTAATDHTSDAVSVPPSLPVQRRSPGGDAPAAAAALPPSGSSTRAARVMSASVDRADAARPPPPQRRSSVMVKVTVSPDSPSMFEGRCLIEHGAVGGSTPARLMLYATEDYDAAHMEHRRLQALHEAGVGLKVLAFVKSPAAVTARHPDRTWCTATAMPSRTLKQFLKQCARTPEAVSDTERLVVVKGLLDIAAVLEAQGLVHGCLTPSCIGLTRTGRPVLLSVDGAVEMGGRMHTITPRFAPPETAAKAVKVLDRGRRGPPLGKTGVVAQHALDVWNVGVLIHQVWSGGKWLVDGVLDGPGAAPADDFDSDGEEAFSPPERDGLDTLLALFDGTVSVEVPDSMPEAVSVLLSYCLEPDPADRWSASDLATHPAVATVLFPEEEMAATQAEAAAGVQSPRRASADAHGFDGDDDDGDGDDGEDEVAAPARRGSVALPAVPPGPPPRAPSISDEPAEEELRSGAGAGAGVGAGVGVGTAAAVLLSPSHPDAAVVLDDDDDDDDDDDFVVGSMVPRLPSAPIDPAVATLARLQRKFAAQANLLTHTGIADHMPPLFALLPPAKASADPASRWWTTFTPAEWATCDMALHVLCDEGCHAVAHPGFPVPADVVGLLARHGRPYLRAVSRLARVACAAGKLSALPLPRLPDRDASAYFDMLVSCLSRHYPSDAAPAIFYAADLAARRIGEDDGDDDLAAAMREVDAATPLNSDAVFIAAAHRLMQSPPLVKTVRRDDGRTAWVCAAHQDLPHYRAVDGAATTLRAPEGTPAEFTAKVKAELDAYAKEIEELRARNQQMEAQLRLAGSTDAPGATMLGFLLKRGGGTRFGGSRKWRERYVVVEQGTLAYFGSENAYKIGKAPLKRRYIPLANYTLDSMTSSIAEFKLVPVRTKTLAAYRRDPSSMPSADRMFCFKVPNASFKKHWLATISRYVTVVRK